MNWQKWEVRAKSRMNASPDKSIGYNVRIQGEDDLVAVTFDDGYPHAIYREYARILLSPKEYKKHVREIDYSKGSNI